jgi:hypothetical protein
VTARALLPLILFLALSPGAGAQTTDPIFARWSWAPPELGGSPSGVGGAFVAVADGTRASYLNPAGLALIPLSEVGLSSGEPWLGAARRVNPLLGMRLGAYVAELEDRRVDLAGLGGPAPTGGSLGASVREAGLSLAAHPIARVRVGGTVSWSRQKLDGERLVFDDRGGGTPAAAVQGETTRVRLTAGMLVGLLGRGGRALPSLRFGLAYQPGFDWSAQMTSAGSTTSIDVRRPSLLSAGLYWRANDRWSFATQADYIRYSEVVDTLTRNVGPAAAAGFSLPSTVEPRFGAEYGVTLWCGCGVVRLRAGVHYQAPGTLRYDGTDPVAVQAFPNRRWHAAAAFGGSFYTEHFANAIRLDVDARDVFDQRTLSVGLAWRF